VLHVQASYDPKERELVDVKTAASRRRVPIAAVLRRHLVAHKLATGRSEGLVFGRNAELPFIGANVQRRSVTAWKKAKLDPILFHEARHTFASLMIAAGVNVKAILTYMGHASVKITLDRYGHLMPNSEEEASTQLDEYLVPASRAPVRATSERITSDQTGREEETGTALIPVNHAG
jgi:integrase